jgi:hypothetical protein
MPASGARISIERRASVFASFSSMSTILLFKASISSLVVIASVASWYWASFSSPFRRSLLLSSSCSLVWDCIQLCRRVSNSFRDACWRSTKPRNRLYSSLIVLKKPFCVAICPPSSSNCAFRLSIFCRSSCCVSSLIRVLRSICWTSISRSEVSTLKICCWVPPSFVAVSRSSVYSSASLSTGSPSRTARFLIHAETGAEIAITPELGRIAPCISTRRA